ncbi:hypothetical protein EYC98_14410 [Halieaceae bacterium IMCC14734]|uniref:Lipoprotein n=1 Tax=Candidatus Litorirhabdus singularis TaxID=2518993 RepID=A0ABT3TL37_9GAMM|nr:hypothetical protein [Candidatus Litorirhabdus singularis]MCX2982052.1 hypothetical protein [Candidatus Litorirhabdus singularis]
MYKLKVRVFALAGACLLMALGGCTTSLHGSFVTSSYPGAMTGSPAEKLGLVEGRSCQTQALYLFANGEPPTTEQAIKDAKSERADTRFIADISIDDEVRWGFGYSVQCIVVRAMAYR